MPPNEYLGFIGRGIYLPLTEFLLLLLLEFTSKELICELCFRHPFKENEKKRHGDYFYRFTRSWKFMETSTLYRLPSTTVAVWSHNTIEKCNRCSKETSGLLMYYTCISKESQSLYSVLLLFVNFQHCMLLFSPIQCYTQYGRE